MSQNVYDVLQERGFIAQTTHEELRELLGKEKVTFYIGFDATADSLTAGHFLTIMAMMHMQKAGHRPIALLGGGTTMIGDPSGKSDMRNMLTKETIDHNAKRFKEQLSRFITFDDDYLYGFYEKDEKAYVGRISFQTEDFEILFSKSEDYEHFDILNDHIYYLDSDSQLKCQDIQSGEITYIG